MSDEPSMIDMMSEDELRMACKELSIDCERQARRIAELEAALLLIRDSTYRNATTLRAMADRALSVPGGSDE